MEIISIAKEVLDHQLQGLSALKENLDDNFTKTINAILNIEGRVVVSGMGKSGHIGKKIAASLASTGTPSFFIHPAEASHGDLGMITKADIVMLLSNSGETSELQSIIDYCIRFDIPYIAISRNGKSTLAKSAKYSLIIPNVQESLDLPAPTTSSTMMLVLGDAIAITCMKLRNFTEDDFSILHPGGNLGARLKKAKDFMHIRNEIPMASSGVAAAEVIAQMTEKGMGCVCIVNENNVLQGFVSDGDVRRNIDKIQHGVAVDEIMSTKPYHIYEDEYLAKCVSIMNDNEITVLVVCNNKKQPIGLLHIHDLLKAGVV